MLADGSEKQVPLQWQCDDVWFCVPDFLCRAKKRVSIPRDPMKHVLEVSRERPCRHLAVSKHNGFDYDCCRLG
jgi:hypothetical protein